MQAHIPHSGRKNKEVISVVPLVSNKASKTYKREWTEKEMREFGYSYNMWKKESSPCPISQIEMPTSQERAASSRFARDMNEG